MVRLKVVRGKRHWYIKGRGEILREMRRTLGLKTKGFHTQRLARVEVRKYKSWWMREYGPPPTTEVSVADSVNDSADSSVTDCVA